MDNSKSHLSDIPPAGCFSTEILIRDRQGIHSVKLIISLVAISLLSSGSKVTTVLTGNVFQKAECRYFQITLRELLFYSTQCE